MTPSRLNDEMLREEAMALRKKMEPDGKVATLYGELIDWSNPHHTLVAGYTFAAHEAISSGVKNDREAWRIWLQEQNRRRWHAPLVVALIGLLIAMAGLVVSLMRAAHDIDRRTSEPTEVRN